MNFFRADLHCHSRCSDGTLFPEELFVLAQKSNLQGLSITDHDTIAAYKNIASIAQAYPHIAWISGVEFSAFQDKRSVHLLGYAFSLTDPGIASFCQAHAHRREKRNQAILEKLALHGMPLEQTELQGDHTLGRPHIAQAMIKKGYVSSIQEAFTLYLGDGRSCYSEGARFTVEETIDVIHQAKGKAILAHPHLIQEPFPVQLLHLPFDGLEGYYGRFSLRQCERWTKIAAHKNWLITGGSDFHGEVKPETYLGSSWTPEVTFNALRTQFLENNPKYS